MPATKPGKKPWIYTQTFASVCPMYVEKAEKKGRTKAEDEPRPRPYHRGGLWRAGRRD